MEPQPAASEKKQYSALTIDRAAFLLLRVKKAFKKKKLQRKERERNAQLAASRVDQRASCAGLEGGAARAAKKPPPLLRSRTLPAIVVPGVNILQAHLGNCTTDCGATTTSSPTNFSSRFMSARVSFCSRDDALPLDTGSRRKSAVSRLCGPGNYGPERGADGTLVLRVPAPHVVAARAYRMSNASNTALYRLGNLGKLLNQSGGSKTPADDSNVTRRLSWERRYSQMPRSSSMDSMVDVMVTRDDDCCAVAEALDPIGTPTSTSRTTIMTPEKRPSLRTDRALVSPSVGRRMKGQRAINELSTLVSEQGEMEVASHHLLPSGGGGANLPPPIGHHIKSAAQSKKQAKLMRQRLEDRAKVNIHLQALFAAVEHGHLEKAQNILDSTDVNVNSLTDGLSPLDIAVLTNNRKLVKMLIEKQACEGSKFTTPDKLCTHLKQLLAEAEMRLQDSRGIQGFPCSSDVNTRASFSNTAASSAAMMAGCAGGDSDKMATAWEKRAETLKKLMLGFTQTRPPDPPSLVAVDITSHASVCVRLQEAVTGDSPITTKFKVQWSTRADFCVISGEKTLNISYNSIDPLSLGAPPKSNATTKPSNNINYCHLELSQGRRYFFRASCGNLKGFGTYLSSTPSSVVPSSWREIDRKKSRFEGRLVDLEQLTDEVKQVRPGSEILENPGPQRRTQRKKTTIKQLFTAASKFQKNLRRGIYLACILYHEDKVLLTNEDFLPVIEIDETFPSCIHTDLHWLMKVTCSWDDVKSLRGDMEKNSSSGIHFRTKLLSAVLQMQSSLGLQDLGQLYYRPLRDSQGGTVVLSTVNYIKNPKSVSVLNSRWLPMNKVFRKKMGSDRNISEILMGSIDEQINYHQVSGSVLSRGLYLAYLKMQSSVDLIQVVVPAKSPNMLPHCKVRDNPHVSAEEWEYLKQQHLPDLTTDNATEQQRTFLELVTSAAKRLFNYMDISPEDASNHRLYDTEIIDLTKDVSFILICPSAEFSCSVPGQREILLQRGDLLSLPIQVFEMIHLNTYQSSIIKNYSKLSCLLELDAATANHLHREAFSNSEVAIARERLAKLHDLQSKLNVIWKTVRWLMDVVTFARDRLVNGVSMRYILEKEIGVICHEQDDMSVDKRLLQIPPRDVASGKIVHKTPGRGSWPGPGTTNIMPPKSLVNEFSKSEQHLSISNINNTISSQYFSDPQSSRKSSNSGSYFSSDFFAGSVSSNGGALAPSRSEDALFAVVPTCSNVNHRCRASTLSSVSATTSPLLSVKPLCSTMGGSLISVNTITSSLHSLSSDDSDANNDISQAYQPINTPPPVMSLVTHKSMPPSRSMTNVKTTNHNNKSSLNHKLSNLESGLSKSLSNLKTSLKSMESSGDFKVPDAGILQVFAAYETGLASGTSIKLHVTPRTTAREVVDLVVKQLNMAVVQRGKKGPVYSPDRLRNFCLVAVIGARERCLRDDFKPLQLQNPWKKGRLYVRQKHDVLAALEHSSKHSALI